MTNIPEETKIKNSLNGVYLFNIGLFEAEGIELNTNIMISGSNGAGKTTFSSFLAFFATGYLRAFYEHSKKSSRHASIFEYFFKYETSFLVYEYKKKDHNVLVAVYAKDKSDELEFCFISLDAGEYDVIDMFNRNSRVEVFNEIDRLAISSKKVDRRDYLKVLYGQNTKKKNDNRDQYAFSHVGNYDTFAKLYYASYSNAEIDSKSIKNIIIEYAQAKSDLNDDSIINFGKHEVALSSFMKDHSAIMEWEKSYPTIDQIRNDLIELNGARKKKVSVLLEVAREVSWYSELLSSFDGDMEEMKEKIKTLGEDEWVLKREHTKKLALSVKEKDSARDLLTALKSKKEDFDKKKELEAMVVEVANKEKYEGELKIGKETLASLSNKVVSEKGKHDAVTSGLIDVLKKKKDSNEKQFLEKKANYLEKSSVFEKEKNKKREQIEKEYPSTELLEKEQREKEDELKEKGDNYRAIEVKAFSSDQRYIELDKSEKKEDETYTALLGKIGKIADSRRILSESEENFLSSHKKKEEMEGKNLEKELSRIDDRIKTLTEIADGEGTLYSKIKKSGMEYGKYVNILSEKALLSTDFELVGNSGEGRQVLDFEIKGDSGLLDGGQSIYEKIKEEREKRVTAKKNYEKEKGELSKINEEFYSKYRLDWKALANEESDTKVKILNTETSLKNIKSNKDKAEEFFLKEKTKKLSELTPSINSLRSYIHTQGLAIEKIRKDKRDALAKINSLIYDAEVDILEAKKVQSEANNDATSIFDKDVLEENERYKKVLSSSGVDSEGIERYAKIVKNLTDKIETIKVWEKTVGEYQAFMGGEWNKLESLNIAYKNRDDAHTSLVKKNDEEEKEMEEKIKAHENSFETLSQSKRMITKNRKKLSESIESYNEELIGKRELEPKTKTEKEETNLEDEADNLIMELNKQTRQIQTLSGSISEVVEKRWSKFIAKGALTFDSYSPLENASRIVEIDDVGEIGILRGATFQKINLSIGEISSQQSTLQEAYGEVKSAIKKVNTDLKDISSTALIESIELREVPKEGGIYKSIEGLSSYWIENRYNMESTLFSSEDGNKHQKEIMSRLNSLLQKIETLSNHDKIVSVGSLFDLQGRVVEKGQDSDWGERVFNSGSEGTQLLIKVSITASLFNMALSGSRDIQVPYLIIDEIGKLDTANVERILAYINSKNSHLVALQPNDNMAKYFNRAYVFKDVRNDKTIIEEYLRNKIPIKFKD